MARDPFLDRSDEQLLAIAHGSMPGSLDHEGAKAILTHRGTTALVRFTRRLVYATWALALEGIALPRRENWVHHET